MAELLESIGRNVRRLREEKGWNQTELGFHADASPSIISLIENGKRNPSTATLAKIAAALGVEVVDLFPKGRPSPHELGKEEWGDKWEDAYAALGHALAQQWRTELEERLKTLAQPSVELAKQHQLYEFLQWVNRISRTQNAYIRPLLEAPTSERVFKVTWGELRKVTNEAFERSKEFLPDAYQAEVDKRFQEIMEENDMLLKQHVNSQ